MQRCSIAEASASSEEFLHADNASASSHVRAGVHIPRNEVDMFYRLRSSDMNATSAVRCVWAWLLARRMRAAFPGPLGGGEAGMIRPRSGRGHGWPRLFARAGCPLEKPGVDSRTFHPWMDGKRQ